MGDVGHACGAARSSSWGWRSLLEPAEVADDADDHLVADQHIAACKAPSPQYLTWEPVDHAPNMTLLERAFATGCHAAPMIGGSRRGPSLAERSADGTAGEVGADPELAALRDRPRPVLTRHCWVTGLPDCPGRWAGLLAEWRQDRAAGGWQGRVVYAVDDGAATVIVEAWVPARHLQPAG